jgi:acetyl esterase/lipase
MARRSTTLAVATMLAVAGVALALTACDPPPPTCSGVTQTRSTVRYRTTAGVAANLQSLDLYRPAIDAECPPPPVIVYVHGGGWRQGDKANNVLRKVDQFAQKNGWLFVSVNYRLSPNPIELVSTAAVRAPTHGQDVAAAIGWVHRNAANYGADPSRIAIMGHSAGAHLVSMVGTDQSLLTGASVPRAAVGCVISLDTAAHDITESAPGNPLYLNAFGSDPASWRANSPIYQVTAGEALPDFLLVHQDRPSSTTRNNRFRDVLRTAGGTATTTPAPLDHSGINDAVGDPADTVVTPAVLSFLGSCFA